MSLSCLPPFTPGLSPPLTRVNSIHRIGRHQLAPFESTQRNCHARNHDSGPSASLPPPPLVFHRLPRTDILVQRTLRDFLHRRQPLRRCPCTAPIPRPPFQPLQFQVPLSTPASTTLSTPSHIPHRTLYDACTGLHWPTGERLCGVSPISPLLGHRSPVLRRVPRDQGAAEGAYADEGCGAFHEEVQGRPSVLVLLDPPPRRHHLIGGPSC